MPFQLHISERELLSCRRLGSGMTGGGCTHALWGVIRGVAGLSVFFLSLDVFEKGVIVTKGCMHSWTHVQRVTR